MKKILRTTSIAALLMSVSLSPVTSFAAEPNDTNYVMSEGSNIKNPWDGKSQTFKVTEPVETGSSKIVYGDEAKAIGDKLKKSQASAAENYNIMQQESSLNSLNNTQSNMAPIQRAALNSKSWYRSEFNALAIAMGTLDCPTAGNFLKHSLQDNPGDRKYPVGSSLSNAFSLTKIYTQISVEMAQQIKKTNSQGGNVIGGMSKSAATSIGNSGLDFYLTVGKFSYDWMAEKQPGKSSWKVYIGIHDTYDYDKVDPLPTAFPTKYITLVANHAANAQQAGAIVPYYVDMFMEQTFTP
ncbi:hypothetical protein [Bacillus toyonensis]|uniref:hypothetical protein n=1 Tax=Bacillus toyonensis TaxID=155322 RepID=UPI00211D1BD3|nr:hypothetical protein [Bacillus toyonensis]